MAGLYFLCLLPLLSLSRGDIIPDEVDDPFVVDGVVGHPVLVPCDTQPLKSGDKQLLVLIFKDNKAKPIYSCDSRATSSSTSCTRWSKSEIKGRAHFWDATNPHEIQALPFDELPSNKLPSSGLVFNPTLKVDEGSYMCRVDFKSSPTQKTYSQLRVVMPISNLTVRGFTPSGTDLPTTPHDSSDAFDVTTKNHSSTSHRNYSKKHYVQGMMWSSTISRRKLNIGPIRDLGPFVAGDELILQCEAIGGSPSPRLEWVEEGATVKPSSRTGGDLRSSSIYRMASLSPNDINRVLTCVGENSKRTPLLVDTVRILVTVPPTGLEVLLRDHSTFNPLNEGSLVKVIEGQTVQMMCSCEGTRPVASILWTSNDVPILGNLIQTVTLASKSSPHLSTTHSTLTLVGSTNLHRSEISCRATVPTLPQFSATRTFSLDVLSSPQVSLSHWPPSVTVRENSTLTLTCDVTAHPPLTGTIYFKRNDVIIGDITPSRRLSQNVSVEVQVLGPESKGTYTCSAENSQGKAMSNPLTLDIQYSPRCASPPTSLFASRADSLLTVQCEVTSNPKPSVYRWYTSTGDSSPLLLKVSPVNETEGSNSLLYRVPLSPPYPSLLCYADNSVGAMTEPCVFTLNTAAAPSAVTHCVVEDDSASLPHGSVSLMCNAGDDGGLNQSFTLEILPVSNIHARPSKSLYMSSKPIFTISGLSASEAYEFTVTSSNARGLSLPVTISYKVPSLETGELSTVVLPEEVAPLLLVILGGMVIVITCIVTAFIIRHIISRRNFKQQQTNNRNGPKVDMEYKRLSKCHHHRYHHNDGKEAVFHLCGVDVHTKLSSPVIRGCVTASSSHGDSCSSYCGDSLSRASTCRSTTETLLWSQNNPDLGSHRTFRNSGCYHIDNLTPPDCVYVRRSPETIVECDRRSLEGSNPELQMITASNNYPLQCLLNQHHRRTDIDISSSSSTASDSKQMPESQHEYSEQKREELPPCSLCPSTVPTVSDGSSCVSPISSRPSSSMSTATVTLNPNYKPLKEVSKRPPDRSVHEKLLFADTVQTES